MRVFREEGLNLLKSLFITYINISRKEMMVTVALSMLETAMA